MPYLLRTDGGLFDHQEQAKVDFVSDNLKEWEGNFESDSTQATVFTLWYGRATELLFSDLE